VSPSPQVPQDWGIQGVEKKIGSRRNQTRTPREEAAKEARENSSTWTQPGPRLQRCYPQTSQAGTQKIEGFLAPGSAEGHSPFARGLGLSPSPKVPPRLGDRGGSNRIEKDRNILPLSTRHSDYSTMTEIFHNNPFNLVVVFDNRNDMIFIVKLLDSK